MNYKKLKNGKYSYNGEEGIFRTIGGRKIFIRDGESLSSAMQRSGKFKTQKNENEHDFKKLNKQIDEENNKKADETIKGIYKEPNEKEVLKNIEKRKMETEDKEKTKKGLTEDEIKKGYNNVEDAIRNEKERNPYENMANDRIKEKENILYNDKVILEEMKKRGLNEINGTTQKDLENRIQKNEEYLKIATSPQNERKHLTDEEINAINGRLNKGKDYSKTARDYEENQDYSTPTENNDYLPKKVEIKEQGKSNRKEVSENIQAHILEYYDSPDDFIEQMDAMDYLPTKWKAGEEIAKGGSYLIYNQDMSDFLNELKINPKGKKFNEEKAFDMYTSLIGRESEKLYDRLTKGRENNYKSAFQQYKKENPGTNMDLNDFIDMMKKKNK